MKPGQRKLIRLPKKLKPNAPGKIDAAKSKYKDLFLFVKPEDKKTIR